MSVTVVVLFGAIVSLVGVSIWLGLLIWAAKGDGRVQREHDRDAQRGQYDADKPADRESLFCSECSRTPRPDENPDDEWRVESDGVGELLVFCPECWQREFGSSG